MEMEMEIGWIFFLKSGWNPFPPKILSVPFLYSPNSPLKLPPKGCTKLDKYPENFLNIHFLFCIIKLGGKNFRTNYQIIFILWDKQEQVDDENNPEQES
jgi:hypothetical protein